MEYLAEIGLFAAKTLFVVIALVIVIATIATLTLRGRSQRSDLETERLNLRYQNYEKKLHSTLLEKRAFKAFLKTGKKHEKSEKRAERRIFVVDFHGDLRAMAVDSLREEVTAILGLARTTDEVVVRLESPGGIVAGYGLAAAQLQRLRDRGIPLTVCVDKIAASGGYMMACVANRIIAAPFAIVGSIGVIAAFANVHRVLEKHDIEYREITAGEFKRTVSLFGEVTPQGMEKFKSQIQDTHALFKEFIKIHRPQLDVAAVSTGEYWFGHRAEKLQLVDSLETSDDYLWKQRETAEIVRIRHIPRRKWHDHLSESISQSAENVLERVLRQTILARFGL